MFDKLTNYLRKMLVFEKIVCYNSQDFGCSAGELTLRASCRKSEKRR